MNEWMNEWMTQNKYNSQQELAKDNEVHQAATNLK